MLLMEKTKMISVALFVASIWVALALWVFRGLIAQGIKNVINSIKNLEGKDE